MFSFLLLKKLITQLQIIVEKLLVLFGKSGLGKSSLLNSGVVPVLRERNNFITIPIRLGLATSENAEPSVIFLNKIAALVNYSNFMWEKCVPEQKENWTSGISDESFWLACKSIQMQNVGKCLVFI